MTVKHLLFLRICIVLPLLTCFTATPSAASDSLAREIATPAPQGSRQHYLTQLDNGKLLLSWVEGEKPSNSFRFAVRLGGAWSKPHTIVTTRDAFAAPPRVLGLKDGSLAAIWMVHPENAKDRYAADIYIALSKDGGRHWSEPRRPYPAAARIYDAQMSAAPLDDGSFALVWTDRRDGNRYRLMAALIGTDGRPTAEKTLDPDVCSCCETRTAANGNTLFTTYRDHLAGEVRDIALTRWNSKGIDSNRIVHADGWVIEGCPSNGPVVASGDAYTMVAWFTAADGVGRVKAAFSADQGAHFDKPVELGTDANGYVDALLLEDGSTVVAWRGRAGPEEELRLARIRPDGTVLARASLHRGGFPRWPSRHLSLAQAGDQIYVAWTDASERRVRLIETPLTVLTAGGNELAMQ
ncbi:sialidase family protein [Methylocaldum szegediense]|uniref:BNR repeat protein n=1 Tax=Methylocaldum szegediense TaxID=73780 RepID=A0ABN8X240_9GAMM|nr:sialidase family protein [Methylocaldum szegediense]CAI8770087.1 BNR repeat protein [Methylocaldum szegediense]